MSGGLLFAFASSSGSAVRMASVVGTDVCRQQDFGLFAIAHNVKGDKVMCVNGRWFSVKRSLRIANSQELTVDLSS